MLATGVVDDLLAIDGIERLWGRTVVHCPHCHGWELRDQPTAVRASSSLDVLLALKVAHLSEDVIVCLNGGPALSPNDDAMLKAAGIAVRPEPIIRIEAEGDQLQRIVSPTATAWSGLCSTCIPPFAQLQRSRPTWVAGSSTTASSRSTMIGDYVVDGHVPAEAIERLLEERPAVDGIALPGMPAGSLGMSGDKTDAFEIVQGRRRAALHERLIQGSNATTSSTRRPDPSTRRLRH